MHLIRRLISLFRRPVPAAAQAFIADMGAIAQSPYSPVQRIEIVSSKPIAEWPLDVLWPIGICQPSIFGQQLSAMVRAYKMPIFDALIACQLAESNSDARRLIRAGAVRLNGRQLKDEKRVLCAEDRMPNLDSIVLEAGRYNFGIIELCD